jgi:hypothetical protein
MINDPGRETAAVATSVKQQPTSSKRLVRIEVTVPEEEDKLWEIIAENGWSGTSFGENIFVFTQEQVATIEQAGVKFRTLD